MLLFTQDGLFYFHGNVAKISIQQNTADDEKCNHGSPAKLKVSLASKCFIQENEFSWIEDWGEMDRGNGSLVIWQTFNHQFENFMMVTTLAMDGKNTRRKLY